MRASWLITLPLAALLVLFAVSNTEVVRLKLWPFDHTADLPLSVAVLGVSAVAFLFGATVAWLAGLPARMKARRLENTANALRAEVEELKKTLARTPGTEKPSPALARR
jgi:uncharacterized integral membrane protein